ncbi:peptidoglycan-binding LysM [Halalkalibacter wakoensis JCM 9140]|uniref:Peptidoglycan-binding LysM n=1 Tax=Halalkalibacter wakoensis JCM 9140 TaxID=1236970 RepID=W4QA12_9BACI|nr:LysM domain-containing protein [Halalkalibacter wakoensis]GAE28493.1 peptidoglycan-binding LysM [Halalkalibacter wakoensis JCM 9140]
MSDDASSETVTHTVQPGNTLWSIANAYDGVNIEQLIERNQGLDPYALPVGAELTIVENNNSGSTSEENITHTVQPGNTLWNIASVYDGVSVQDLLDANPEVDEHSIPVGSTIYIPIS